MFFYDLSTGKCVAQNTTDVNGQTTSVYGSYTITDPGIPSDRHSMCAVVGTDADHTEFNVYLLGGQNDTATPGDIWALTMPGQVAQHTNSDFCLADFCPIIVPCGSAWDH